MRVISAGRDYIKIMPEDVHDLWFLWKIVPKGAFVSGKTRRTVKRGSSQERRTVWLKINVEETILMGDSLKIRGRIVEGPEEVERGKYHTFDVRPGTVITIEMKITPAIIEFLERANIIKRRICAVSVEDDEIIVADIGKYRIDVLERISLPKPCKGDPQYSKVLEDNLKFIARKVEEYRDRYDVVIVCGIPILVDMLRRRVKDSNNIIFVGTAYGGIAGIREVLRRREIISAIKDIYCSIVNRIIDEALVRLAKGERTVALGEDAVGKALDAGAVEVLLIHGSLLPDRIDMLEKASSTAAKFFIVPEGSEGADTLEKLGKVLALLRFPLYLDE